MKVEPQFKIFSGDYISTVGAPLIILAMSQSDKHSVLIERYTILYFLDRANPPTLTHQGTSWLIGEDEPDGIISDLSLFHSELQTAKSAFEKYIFGNYKNAPFVFQPLNYKFEPMDEKVLRKLYAIYPLYHSLMVIRQLTRCKALIAALEPLFKQRRYTPEAVNLSEESPTRMAR